MNRSHFNTELLFRLSWVLSAAAGLLVLAALPFYLSPSRAFWEGLLFLPLALLALALLGLLPLGWVAQRKLLPITLLNPALLLLALMALVSAWTTYDLSLSLPALARLVYGLALFFTFAAYGRTRAGFWIGLTLFSLLGGAVALVSLFGMDWPLSASLSKLPLLYAYLPPASPLVKGLFGETQGFNPNIVSGALLWVLPPAAGLGLTLLKESLRALRQKGSLWIWRMLACGLGALAAALLCALMAGVLLLAQSRSAYAALLLTLLLIGFSLLLLALPRRPRLYAAAVALGSLIALGILAAPFLPALTGLLTSPGTLVDAPASLSTVSLAQRITYWTYGLAALRDFPLTGLGLDTFRYLIFPLFHLPCAAPVCDISHAHNEFLQVALALGLPGLVALLAVYLGAFWMLLRLWIRAGRARIQGLSLRILVLGLGAGLIAHFIFGLTDAVLFAAKPDLLFWILLGLLCGLYHQFAPEQTPAQPL